MIIVEDIIQVEVSKMLAINLFDNRTQKPTYGWGDKNELNKYLSINKNKSYPLVWQKLSSKSKTGNEVSQTCEFIFAVNFRKEELDLMNPDRLEATFKPVLYPFMESFLQALNKSRNITINVNEYDFSDIPNYPVTSLDDDVVDLWDAVSVSIDATFMNNC
jgi:hypothetical protein|tara:strand:- start:66 stop:548 length:483 start_codon:yes stop_codon:yes gene_type:complete